MRDFFPRGTKALPKFFVRLRTNILNTVLLTHKNYERLTSIHNFIHTYTTLSWSMGRTFTLNDYSIKNLLIYILTNLLSFFY